MVSVNSAILHLYLRLLIYVNELLFDLFFWSVILASHTTGDKRLSLKMDETIGECEKNIAARLGIYNRL